MFELLGDILRNRISPLVVGEYLLNVAPFFLYNVLHLSILLAVLITLGLMQRSNEITAIKATGISIYRVIVPILVVSTMLAARAVLFRPVLSSPRQQAAGRAAQPDQGQAGADLSESRPQMDFRTALDHLLLPVLRFRPRTSSAIFRYSNSTRRLSS